MQIGRIIKNMADLYTVELEENKIYQCKARGKLKKEEISPVVGDMVEIEEVQEEKKEGIICTVLTRTSYIKRPKMANLTKLIFVVSMKMPKPDLYLLDKQLVFARWNNIKPVILLNKIDLEEQETIKQIEVMYKKIGYTVLKTNAQQKEGIEGLRKELEENITAFSGNSGVGKSTLINNIFSELKTEEGIISKKNQKGKNTTTGISLYKLDEVSYIADTPGFSSFDIEEIESKDLAKYFVEFEEEIEKCEYVGCSHIKEECCGIKQAMIEGKINKKRYESYKRMYQELKEKEEHKW